MGVYYLIMSEETIIKDDTERRIELHSNGTWHALRVVSPLRRAPEHKLQTDNGFMPLEGMTQEHFDGLYTIVSEYDRKRRVGEDTRELNELKREIEAEIGLLEGIIAKTNPAGLQGRLHPEGNYLRAVFYVNSSTNIASLHA